MMFGTLASTIYCPEYNVLGDGAAGYAVELYWAGFGCCGAVGCLVHKYGRIRNCECGPIGDWLDGLSERDGRLAYLLRLQFVGGSVVRIHVYCVRRSFAAHVWRGAVNEESVALVDAVRIWLRCVWVAMVVGAIRQGALLRRIHMPLVWLHMDTVALMVWPLALVAVRILSVGARYEWRTVGGNIQSIWITTILIGVWSWLTLNGQQRRCTRNR